MVKKAIRVMMALLLIGGGALMTSAAQVEPAETNVAGPPAWAKAHDCCGQLEDGEKPQGMGDREKREAVTAIDLHKTVGRSRRFFSGVQK